MSYLQDDDPNQQQQVQSFMRPAQPPQAPQGMAGALGQQQGAAGAMQSALGQQPKAPQAIGGPVAAPAPIPFGNVTAPQHTQAPQGGMMGQQPSAPAPQQPYGAPRPPAPQGMAPQTMQQNQQAKRQYYGE